MHSTNGTTKHEYLFEQVVLAMNKFELPVEQLRVFTTNGAPAMVGPQKGLTALVQAPQLSAFKCEIV